LGLAERHRLHRAAAGVHRSESHGRPLGLGWKSRRQQAAPASHRLTSGLDETAKETARAAPKTYGLAGRIRPTARPSS
jgi:hypothetical protein